MNDLTIIGAGVAGRACIEAIRQRDKGIRLTVIDKNNFSVARRDCITYPTDTSRCLNLHDWAEQYSVDFVHSQLERVNPRRRKLYFKEGEPRDYQTLIIATGLASRKLSVKGEHRDGFFYFSELNPYAMRDAVKISQEAVVQASSWLGIRFAVSLRSLRMDVRFVAANYDFLAEYAQRVLELLGQKNIVIHEACRIEEVLGEGSIKAVKFSPLKVVSTQLVAIDSGFDANADFFEEDVVLQENVYTNMDDVYFLGDVTRRTAAADVYFIHNHDDAVRQAQEFVSAFMEGRRLSFQYREPDAAAIEQACRIILNDICPVSQKTEN